MDCFFPGEGFGRGKHQETVFKETVLGFQFGDHQIPVNGITGVDDISALPGHCDRGFFDYLTTVDGQIEQRYPEQADQREKNVASGARP